MPIDYKKLQHDLAVASAAAQQAAAGLVDQPPCNADNVLLILPRAHEARLRPIVEAAGLYVYKLLPGYFHLIPPGQGQGSRRSAATRVLCDGLAAAGWEVLVESRDA